MRLYILAEESGKIAAIGKMLQLDDQKRKQTVIDALLAADPTKNKRFGLWLAVLVNRGFISVRGAIAPTPQTQIRLPEDQQRIQQVLTTFERALKRLPQDKREITKYKDFYSLEDVVDKLAQEGQVAAATKARQVPGAEIIYNEPPYTVYFIEKVRSAKKRLRADVDRTDRYAHHEPENLEPYTPEELERIKAVAILGMGPPETKWCTRAVFQNRDLANSYASRYLSMAPMFVIYKDGKPFIQKCGKQIMDVNDRPIKVPPELEAAVNKVSKVDPGKFPPNLRVENGVLIPASGPENAIKDALIFDSGHGFYYCLKDFKTFRRSKLSRGLRNLAQLGLLKYKKVYSDAEGLKAAEKELKQLGDALHKLGYPSYGEPETPEAAAELHRVTAERRKLRDAYNEANRRVKSLEGKYEVTGPDTVLTVNYENVVDILDSSGRSLKTNGQQPAVESFASRLSRIFDI